MKNLFRIFPLLSVLFFLLSCSSNSQNNFINLAGKWKFSLTDDLKYKDIDFDDSKWAEVEVPKRLEKQGYKNLYGIGWYRKKIVIPDKFRQDIIGVYFSNIADADEVYLNGVKIGKSGSFEKNGNITPHFSKVYLLPLNFLNKEGSNLLAVRIFKEYGPFFGIFAKDPLVGDFSKLGDKVSFENYIKSVLIFFAALLILMLGAYHIILYFYSNNRKDYLIFAITCLFFFFFEGSLSFIPYSNFNNLILSTKINIISLITSVAFLLLFIIKYFNVKSKMLPTLNIVVAAVFTISTLIVNQPNLNLRIFNLYFPFATMFTFVMLYISIKNVLINKNKGNLFIPIGLIVVIITSTNDALITLGLYYFNFLNSYGFLFFLIGIAISLAIDFGNTAKAEKLKTRSLDNITKAVTGLTTKLDLEKQANNSVEFLKKHLQIERCTIVLADENGELSNKSKVYGDDLKEPIEEIGWVMENGQTKPYIMKDIEDTFSGVQEADNKKYRQMMLVPMILQDKRIGIIVLSKKIEGVNFTDDDKKFVSIIAPPLAMAVENATTYNASQDQVKKQRDALIMQEKMAAIGQLTSGIGHEINNPVNFIINFIAPIKENVEKLVAILELYEQLQKMDSTVGEEIAAQPSVARNDRDLILKQIEEIKNKGKLDSKLPRILKALDGIADGAKRIANIVDSLKAYSRVGNLPEEIDINDAIDKSLVIIASKLKNRVEVQKEYGENVKAKCYFSINQVIVNLISNAADAITDHPHPASPLKGEGLDRTEKGEIFIKTQNLKDKIRFSVRDTGSGMTEEVKKKLFTPFFTTKGPGKGTGLGLSISYNIVYDQHHGSIDIQSEPGKGTTFTVTIPKDIPTL